MSDVNIRSNTARSNPIMLTWAGVGIPPFVSTTAGTGHRSSGKAAHLIYPNRTGYLLDPDELDRWNKQFAGLPAAIQSIAPLR